MNRVIILFLCFMLWFPWLNAQEPNKQASKIRYLDFETGYFRSGVLDKSLTPLLLIGNGLNYNLSYSCKNQKRINRFNIQFASIDYYPKDNTIPNSFVVQIHNVNTTYYLYPEKWYNLFFSFEHLRKIKTDMLDVYLGGIFDNYYQLMDFDSWITANTLGVKASASYPINEKHNISASVQMPLLSYVGRPPYATCNDATLFDPIYKTSFSGQLLFINKYFYTTFGLNYNYGFSKRFKLLMSYTFRYYNCEVNREYNSVINVLNGGVRYVF